MVSFIELQNAVRNIGICDFGAASFLAKSNCQHILPKANQNAIYYLYFLYYGYIKIPVYKLYNIKLYYIIHIIRIV